MRVANLDGRLVIVTGEAGHEIGYDVEKSSGGQFSADPQAVYDVWGAFTTWAAAGQFTEPRAGPAGGARLARARTATGIRHRPQLPRARRRVRLRRPGHRAPGVHQVPELHHRPQR